MALQTVKALLTEAALRTLTPAIHWFCPDAGCEVVYYDEGGQTYRRADLRVPVWQKEPFGARVVCYCFGEDEASIRAKVDATGTSLAVERVRAHIEAGRCACEVRNPRGVCCLGDLGVAIKRVSATLRIASSPILPSQGALPLDIPAEPLGWFGSVFWRAPRA